MSEAPLRPGRRRVLTAGAGLFLAPLGTWPRLAAGDARAGASGIKRLALRNAVTGEELDAEFHCGEGYAPGAMTQIEGLLRDERTGQRHAIDPQLLDHLHTLARHCAVDPVFSVLAGFRSPQPAQPAQARSLHSLGRAVDVRLRGVDAEELAARALELGSGGVGYYRKLSFVHLDTGARRCWNG
jgi:uncharacterized protein YcbK (DUF882 family)